VAAAIRGRPPPESSSGTLGDLLYADRTKSPVPESEWADLVRAIAARDSRALHALFERTQRIVFTLIMRVTNDRGTAEELTLDVFHDVWRRAADYHPSGGTVIGWIMNQARSRAIDRVRFESRKKRAGDLRDAPRPGARDLQEDLELSERVRELRRAMEGLAPAEREAIEIAYFSGMTYAEVAERLAEPLGTIKTRIRAGLEKLRRALGNVLREP
jgi:RNA polymerase sigma-70 factor (ECF subfamily)